MRRRLLLLSAVLTAAALLAPQSAADAPPGAPGSFEHPQIVDTAGDPYAHPLYTGHRQFSDTDILKVWADYDAADDRVGLHFHLMDTSDWKNPSPDDEYWCRGSVNVTGAGADVGHLAFGWKLDRGAKAPDAYATFSRPGVVGNEKLPSTNQTEFARPGNFSVLLDRAVLVARGDALGPATAACELIWPLVAPQTGSSMGTGDFANGTIGLDILALSPGHDAGNPAAPHFAAKRSAAATAGKSPGFGADAVVAALSAWGLVRRGTRDGRKGRP